jgi:hypothetical protein
MGSWIGGGGHKKRDQVAANFPLLDVPIRQEL